ncbi:hypothetical protein SCUP234_09852 [Seiridium cupressi]
MAFPSEQGRTVLAVMWTQTIVALIFVILRLYTRRVLLRNIGLDDHLSWVSMILFLLYTIFVTVAAMHGLGSHATELTLEQFAMSTKWELMGQTANILAIATSKSSVAVFLIRIVNVNWHKWLLHFSVFSTFFVCVSCVIFMYTQCTPAQGIWDPRVMTVCHINFTANAIFSGTYTAAIDFFLAVFPWFILWNLKMKRKERLTIAVGLSLGIIAGVCGIVRAVVLERIDAKSDYPCEFIQLPVIFVVGTNLRVKRVAGLPSVRDDTSPTSFLQSGHRQWKLRRSILLAKEIWITRIESPLVRVNTLSPGYIRTAATAESLQKPDMETQWVGDNMLYRLSTADEFRAPVLFLLGDEMERRTENLLKGQARRYQPTSQERSPPPFTKAQLRMFVENYSLAAAKPNSNRLRKLKSSLRGIQNSGKSFDEVQGQLNQVIAELDQAFFFSLLRGDVRRDSGREASDAPVVAPQPLVKLQVQVASPGQQEGGFLSGERRGGYRREENCIIIYLAEERPPFDKYLATLAHEVIHAYLWIFAHDYSHHGTLNLFVLDKLLVWAPESAGLLEARKSQEVEGAFLLSHFMRTGFLFSSLCNISSFMMSGSYNPNATTKIFPVQYYDRRKYRVNHIESATYGLSTGARIGVGVGQQSLVSSDWLLCFYI